MRVGRMLIAYHSLDNQAGVLVGWCYRVMRYAWPCRTAATVINSRQSAADYAQRKIVFTGGHKAYEANLTA